MKFKSYFARDVKNKEKLAMECVDIANSAKFNTDYNDVYEHLFFGDNLMLVFAFDDNDQMKAFSSLYLTAEEDGTPHIHLNGIVVSPEMQGKGLAKLMVSRAIGYIYGMYNMKEDANFRISASARTQNPAIYKLLLRNSEAISPNIDSHVEPEHSYIVRKMEKELKPFLGNYDEGFVVANAYPTPKIQANVPDENVKNLFRKLGKHDAFIIFADRMKNLNRDQIKCGIEDFKQANQAQVSHETPARPVSENGFIISDPVRGERVTPCHPMSQEKEEKVEKTTPSQTEEEQSFGM